MTILSISRDWGVSPSIVRITDDANYATISATGYVFGQLPVISALQKGTFQWISTDEILISYSDGSGYFTYNSTTGTFVPQAENTPTVTTIQGTAGQVLVNGTAGTPVSGAVVLTSASPIVGWLGASGTTQTMALNTGYVVQNAAQTTFTLPVTAPLGSVEMIAGNGAGGFVLHPGAGQTIRTPVGVASTSITSAEADDFLAVICVVANTTWLLMPSSSSGLIIV